MEGQLVAVRGRLSGFGHRKDLFCLANCAINLWDGNSTVKACIDEQPGVVQVDHLWVSLESETTEVKRYERFGLLGRVGWYSKADGSVDLGIVDPGNNLIIDDLMRDIANRPQKDSAATTRNLLRANQKLIAKHEKGEVILWGVDCDLASFSKIIDRYLHKYSKTVEASDKALGTATMNGRCKQLREVAKMPRQALKKASGFN